MGKFGGGHWLYGWRGEFSLFSMKKALPYVNDPGVGLEILLINVLSRLWCECQLHSEGTVRTVLHWCVRTTPPCSVNGEGHTFMEEPWLPRSCRQDQAEVPAWMPRGTCVLQIGNPRETPPFPGQPFPSAASSSPPQTTCGQNKLDPAAPRCCGGSVPVRKAAQNLPVPDILSVWLFNVTVSHGETR